MDENYLCSENFADAIEAMFELDSFDKAIQHIFEEVIEKRAV